jgi:hypothetical protein
MTRAGTELVQGSSAITFCLLGVSMGPAGRVTGGMKIFGEPPEGLHGRSGGQYAREGLGTPPRRRGAQGGA